MSHSAPTPRGMPYQAQPGARTTSGTHSFPPPFFLTSSESPYEPMDTSEDLLQQPDSPTSLEPPVWPDSRIVSPLPLPSPQYQPQHLSETMPSSGGMVSAPVNYARVIPPTHVGSTIVPSTHSTPIPLIHGAPIPLAQSIPTLVPCRTVQLPPQVCLASKWPCASSTPMTIPTLPAYEPPLNPLQVYQDAHTTWFGQLLIMMVAILHTKHRVWAQNKCLRAKSLIRCAVTLCFESSEGSMMISSSYMKTVSCITHQVIHKDEGSVPYS
ncbi:hypothetical protein PAXRUDRAFT_35561 [Paxillus rubicundulus Ve08.2h10]|uniref:Unplaced genomic scaffold scaffold_802, whole genome shotgun sequence n=1 Tax=Paxillus rubicundulus Ve08.2h10 TaxID=930991 RepID=A0A0D0DDQ8_9AGAM|nr:hypothetical protein PAXRUDRAFT_35561 [Paxillus rubicundulus Ve08.2h10]